VRNQIRVDETFATVLGLNPGEKKAGEQDCEAFPARHGSHYVGSFSGLSENLCIFWMVLAIDVPHVVSPGG